MTREAAILGVQSVSFFRGRPGQVDAALENAGTLCFLSSAQDASELDLDRPRLKEAWSKEQNTVREVIRRIIG